MIVVRGGEATGADAWGIFGAVPLSTRKNAKSGEQGTQLACGSNKCPLSSNAFSRAPRGSQPQNQARPCPKPHPRCVLACLGGLFLSRRDKKAREFVEE